MAIADFFKKSSSGSYDAAAEFFITPELQIHEGNNGDYSLAIDTGYEDLKRTVKRVVLAGSEISIKTETSYVEFQELYDQLGILVPSEAPPIATASLTNLSKTHEKTELLATKSASKTVGTDDKKTKVSDVTLPESLKGAILSSDLPETIRLKQADVVADGVYYKPLKVVSTLITQHGHDAVESDIATSYYLAPVSFMNGNYVALSPAQCSHIVETSWSDAYIEAMNGGAETVSANSSTKYSSKKSAAKTAFKAPIIVALSLATAFASLYGFNQYQQNSNPLALAASNGTVGTYMNAKGSNTDEYTQRQLEATKAALSSMGIDVSADADIGCLIE